MSYRLILFFFFSIAVLQLSAATHPVLEADLGRVPLSFEANQGQLDAQVRFLARTGGQVLYLTRREAIIAMGDERRRSALRMSFVGGRPDAEVVGVEELPGKSHFLIGSDPSRWRTNVPTYGSVVYRNVYTGIDLRFHGNQSQLEYDFVVAAGADSGRIRLLLSGAKKLTVNAGGDLEIKLDGGRSIRQHRPVVYQETDHGRRNIAAQYRILGRRGGGYEVAFELGGYDVSRALIIDPVLSFSTYFGGAAARSSNEARAVAVDRDGSVYFTGRSFASDLPTTPGAFQPAAKGTDAFVAKLNASGSAILYCTYIGGESDDQAFAIAVDAAGNAYVAGETRSNNFPVRNAIQQTWGGGYDAFALELNANGSDLVYSTYLGGSADDHGNGLAIDAAGATYVAGQTSSSNFPVRNAVQSALAPSGSSSPNDDVFVSKIAPGGTDLIYSTFYGASGTDRATAIATDKTGAAYVTGLAASQFPTTANPFHPQRPCGGDAFVLKLNPTGGVSYSVCMGGGSAQQGYGIAADSDGNAYVVGGTTSATSTGANAFPFVNPLQPASGLGKEDAFISKLNSSGSALLFSTPLGGPQIDRALSVALDSFNNIYVTGLTEATALPTVNPIQAKLGGTQGYSDAFAVKLKSDGSAMIWSTYLGGDTVDEGRGIAVDASGNAYLAGIAGSKNFPAANALQAALGGGSSNQSFVSRIGEIPVISPNGLLGGATFTAGLAPGAIVSLFGNFLAASSGGAAAVPLPTTLSGATVKVNGIAAPLYFASPTQINFQMPYETQAGAAQVTVTLANLSSDPTTIGIVASAPGIFTTSSTGKGQGVVLDAISGVLAAPSGSIPGAAAQPIAKGQFVTIYASGLGAVTNQPASGAAASSTNLSTTTSPVTVTVGGATVTAAFAGLVPGLVGLYQVNIPIPVGTPSGDAVPMSLSVGGVQSNTVTIAIQP